MSTTGIILGASSILCAVLFVVLAVPLYNGSVEMNRWYGFRIRKAFSSEENWYKINRYGAKRLMLWSIPIFLAGIAAFFVPLGPENAENQPLILGFALAPLFVIVPVIETLLYARKL